MWIYKSYQDTPSQAELPLYLYFFMDSETKHYEPTSANEVLILQGFSTKHRKITRAEHAI